MYQNISYDWNGHYIHIWDDLYGYKKVKYKPYAYKKNDFGDMKSIFGDTVSKIPLPRKFRDMDNDERRLIFEGDVHPERRYLIDNYTDDDEPSTGIRTLFFDIETEMAKGFPTAENPICKITAFTMYDRIANQYSVAVIDPDLRCSIESSDNIIIKKCADEVELLEYFLDKIEEIRPHIISGWNSDRFDVPYLCARMNKVFNEVGHHRSVYDLSEIKRVSGDGLGRNSGKGRGFIRIGGIASLDYLLLYKKFSIGERPSYALDAIAELEIDTKKIKYDGTLDDLYRDDIDKFVQYNIHDVRILKELDDKLDYIEVARALCHKAHVAYDLFHHASTILDGTILTYLKRRGIVAPSVLKPDEGSEREKFEGAFVKDPQAGRHDWVFDIDATSMYPNIIMSLNISPETKIGKVEGWNVGKYLKNQPLDCKLLRKDGEPIGEVWENKDLANLLNNKNCSIAPNGVMYRTDEQGLIPSILDEWFKERVKFKKIRDDAYKTEDINKAQLFDRRQYIQKILLNSMYGVAALPVFRFYDVDNAASVTATGRAMIRYAEKRGNDFYKDKTNDPKDYCIYIDTDSLLFSAKPLIDTMYPDIDKTDNDVMVDTTLNICEQFQDYVNIGMDKFASDFINIDEHSFSFKQELIALSGFFITKKRYALWIVNNEGTPMEKMEVKGIDIVRSNFPEAFKTLLRNVLVGILHGEKKEKMDNEITVFKKDVKNTAVEEIAISTGVKNLRKYTNIVTSKPTKGSPAHVRASLNHNWLLNHKKLTDQYMEIESNSKIKWVYLKSNPYRFDKIAFKAEHNSPEIMKFIEQYIDKNKIFKQLVERKLDTFYSAMEWARIKSATNTIDKFFI